MPVHKFVHASRSHPGEHKFKILGILMTGGTAAMAADHGGRTPFNPWQPPGMHLKASWTFDMLGEGEGKS